MESKFTQNEISFNLYTNSQRRQLNFKQNSDLSSFRNQNFDNDQHVSYENLNLDFEEIVGSHQKIKNQETLAQESEIRKQKINFFKDQKSRIFSKKSQSIRKPNQIGYQIEELQIEEQEREQGKEIQINPIGNNNVNISRDIKEQKKNPLLNDHNQKYKALEILQKERMKVKVQKFQELSEQYRFRCLQYEHLEIIGDKSYFSRVKSKCASIFNTLPQIYRTSIDYASVAINKSMLLDPEGFVSSLTGSLVAIMSYSNFLISSLRINFPDFCNQDGHECISSFPFSEISIFCFLVKIIISLNTACKYKGKLLNDRSIILKSYMRKEFFIDIVPLIQIAIFTYTGFYYLGFIHILRLPYAFKLAEKLLEYFHIESRFFTFYQLTRLILLIFTVAHVCSVGFLLIAHFPQNNDNDNWIRNQNLQNSQWYDQYERSLYFVMITMITVGFGDITPVNSRERIYVILMTLISCGVFAYAVNTVGYIFQQKDNEQSNLKQK